jgi:hypothetical protein
MGEALRQVPIPPGFGETRGSEHEVWLAEAGDRVIKATHAGEFGRKFGPERFATKEEYLARIGLTVSEFALDWRIEGIHGSGKGERIVTSQPLLVGTPPSLPAIAEFMRQRRFVLHKTRFGDAWFRKEDGLLVSDAEPKNAVTTCVGILPFDFLIASPPPELLEMAGIH